MYASHPSVQQAGFTSDAFKPGLDAMKAFAARLSNPQNRFRSIHVAGTNGKGSVSSMLAASLAAGGLKVGLYTSPHLVDFRERMKIVTDHAELIPREDVAEFLQSQRTYGLSFFEVTTGMAFWWFARENVDVAVIETGLGGRLDSTNIIAPELAVITSIGLDHCAILGSTRAEIAAEKGGIFKAGVPAVVALRDDETSPVFERIASEVHCPLFFADDFFENDESGVFSADSPASVREKVGSGENAPDLRGPYQAMNLRTVLCCLNLLGVKADMDVLCRTAAITGFRGRWERLQENPEVICDIGHNPAALEINFKRLKELGRPLVIVYGIMADKDLDGIAPLMPADAVYVLAAPSTSRALDVSSLEERLHVLRPDLDLRHADSVREAVTSALQLAGGMSDPLVYIGGSTFVVAEAVPLFG